MNMNNHRVAQIMLVDDDRLALQHAKLVFNRAKITNVLHSVESGIEALDFLLKRNGYEDAVDIDLIYCDLHMNDLMGTELLEIIQSEPKLSHIPVIMITSSESEADIDMASEFGAIAYIPKPLNVNKIMETILLDHKIKICISCENTTD